VGREHEARAYRSGQNSLGTHVIILRPWAAIFLDLSILLVQLIPPDSHGVGVVWVGAVSNYVQPARLTTTPPLCLIGFPGGCTVLIHYTRYVQQHNSITLDRYAPPQKKEEEEEEMTEGYE
jgi:hypothetical protein